VLVTGGGTGLSSWAIGADGALTAKAGSPFAFTTASSTTSLAVVTVGSHAFAYATQNGIGAIEGFEIKADGTLAHLAGFPKTGLAGVYGLGAGGNKLLVVDSAQSQFRSYTVAGTGALKQAPGSPFVLDSGTAYQFRWVFVEPKGKFAYSSAVNTAAALNGFKIAGNGKLKNVSVDFPIGIYPDQGAGGMSMSSKKILALMSTSGANPLETLRLPSNGNLHPAVPNGQNPAISNPGAHAFSPDGSFLVIANSNAVRVVSVDATGTIAPLASTPVAGVTSQNGMVIIAK
jgi:hypothetical protein